MRSDGSKFRRKAKYFVMMMSLVVMMLTSVSVYAYSIFTDTRYVYLSGYINLRVEMPDGSQSMYRVNCSVPHNDYAGS